jgi:uncharacterized protein (DUF362 family)
MEDIFAIFPHNGKNVSTPWKSFAHSTPPPPAIQRRFHALTIPFGTGTLIPMHRIPRREFLKTAAAVAAAAAFAPRQLFAEAPSALARVVAVHGTDVPLMLKTGIDALGGWSAFVQQGQRVTLKVNAGWASTPEQGANTHPALVEECIRACKAAGAATVTLPEKSCSPSDTSFEMSGIGAAVQRAGGRLYALDDDKDFQTMDIPQGKNLKTAEIARDVLDTDCLINMPVAKSHGGATLTIGMKNWMGSVRDRGFWHRNKLHQCIADCSTVIKPKLIIVDATRIMVAKGPRGPGPMEYPHQIVFGTDPVAVDAYVATLFQKEPFSIPYIQIAHDMGIGCGDLAKIELRHLQA